MNMRKFISKIGFAIILLSLSLSAEGFERISDYVLVGIMALAATVLLFENKSSKPFWKSLVRWSDDMDITYVVFGLGLMLVSSEFSNIVWATLLLLVSGAVFAGAGIGKLIGTGFSEVLKTNAKIGIIFGFICLVAGVVVCITTWNSILAEPLSNAPRPILIICVAILFIYFGWNKWRKSRKPLNR